MEYGVVVRWWALYQALLLVGLPFTSRLLPDAPDSGASLAIPTALALLTVPLFWVGHFAFGPLVVAGVAVAVIAVSAWLARDGVDVDARRYAEVVAVFTVAFAFLVAIRAASNGIAPGGGEKFLDFGLLQSLLRADRLPPQDMWYAGERVVYYYGGHLMTAALAMLSGTQGRFAYSPALAGFYAMAVTGAYGLASTIAARTGAPAVLAGGERSLGDDERSQTDGERSQADGGTAQETGVWTGGERAVRPSIALGVTGAVLGVALVAFDVSWWILVTPAAFALAVVTRSRRVRAGALAAFVFGFASNVLTPLRLLAGASTALRGFIAGTGMNDAWSLATTPKTFDMWHASRVIGTGINEFPLFAYLNGDLHGHMMSVAVLFVVVGISLAYYRTPAERRWRRRGLLFVASPVAAGLILTVNTWSFPTALGVPALAVALADAPPRTLLPARVASRLERDRGPLREIQRILLAVVAAVVVGALALVAVWPFVVSVLLVGASSQHPAVLPAPSHLESFLVIHGVFLVAFAAYLVSRVARDWRDWLAAGLAVVGFAGIAASFDLVVAGVRLDFVGVAVGGPLLVGAWLLRRRDRIGFEGVLVVAGTGLVVLVEYVYLSDAASFERYNTVFKVYAQVWALWSVAAGVALAAFASRVWRAGERQSAVREHSRSWTPDGAQLRETAGTALVAVLVVSTSIYGGLALGNHFGSMDEATIDGMEYAHDTRPHQAEAIEWLNDKPGQPHIVSAPGLSTYSWVNPASSLTGIPTVAGWQHAANYHSEEGYQTRVSDVRVIYKTADPSSRAALLRKHDVAYIWVGPIERNRWDVAEMVDEPGIEPAFRNAEVTVYAVNRTALVETPNADEAE
ncbi:DUF2298 domain-containing protein [Halobacterium zhouii]|uniref:DUF2298 domain-containing protein n=1 Tax=Halobacterium zhouii TaxID=2902624 RepID=UPI001E45F8BC|nr:DUF2298 domain-containing protein [Halobacterium zhouii]